MDKYTSQTVVMIIDVSKTKMLTNLVLRRLRKQYSVKNKLHHISISAPKFVYIEATKLKNRLDEWYKLIEITLQNRTAQKRWND